jgi:hypothetical protein
MQSQLIKFNNKFKLILSLKFFSKEIFGNNYEENFPDTDCGDNYC